MHTIEEVRQIVDDALDKTLACYQEGRLVTAERILNHILEHFDTEEPRGLQLLGLVKHKQQKYEEAIEIFNKAIEVDPKNAENHNNRGLCYSALGEYSLAMKSIYRAMSLKPDNYLYYNNIGHQYRLQKTHDKALEWFRKALAKNITAPEVLHNIGGCYFEMKELDKSIKYMEKAVELSPDNAGMKVDLAYTYQAAKKWEKAWKLYEYRMEHFQQAAYFKTKYDTDKLLTRKPEPGKTLVVYCEQGVGDLIQSLRYVKYLKKKKVDVVVECPESMISLLVANGYTVTADGSEINHDYHCSIMSLPYFLNTVITTEFLGFEDFAESGPYLKAHQEADLSDYDNKFRVGIAWAGNPMHPKDRDRSCYLNEFDRLNNLSNIKLFSFQKDTRPRIWPPQKEPVDLTDGSDDMRVVDTSEYLNDWQSTAALLEKMDAVVTVDTAILHLAGALGVRTYLLLPDVPDTRWGFDGNSTFWYPTVHIIRQSEPGNWKPMFKEVTRLLVNNTKY